MHPTYQNQRHKADPEDFFPRTKIQHTDTSNAPRKRTSEYRIQNNEECNGTSHGSRIGRNAWKYQKATYMRTTLSEMGHQLPTTPVATDNTAANSIVEGTSKKNILSNRHDILLGQRQNTTKPFPHIMGKGRENLADYVKKNTTQYGTIEQWDQDM